MPGTVDVVVVGGGIIGLTVAWRARAAGQSVALLERHSTGAGTSHVAAGMLAPVAEVEFGAAGRHVLELGVRSAAMWPDFAAELQQATAIDVGLRRTGTLVVARDEDEARELDRQLAFRESLGLPAERCSPSRAREREPALAPTLRQALLAPEDHSVDPRLVLAALRAACIAEGVQLHEHTPVAGVELGGEDRMGVEGSAKHTPVAGVELGGEDRMGIEGDGKRRRVLGVRLQNGESMHAGQVVLAAGAWTGQLRGLPEQAMVPVRPVKGQILRLHDPAGPGLLDGVVRFAGGYLVPRGDGCYVLGATMEERGYELAPTAGGVYELLRDAHELIPGVAELQIDELSVGLRPSTPDNAPVIGAGALDGLVWATGHHRNGILLAPLTAQLVVEALVGRAGAEPATARRSSHASAGVPA
jgi:glycine oxidase